MKLVIHYLEQVEFADKFQSWAFLFFFVLFIAIAIWVFSGEKELYESNGNLPLQEDDLFNVQSKLKKE